MRRLDWSLFRRSIVALFELAYEYFRLRQYDDAVVLFKRVLTADAKDPEAWCNYGLSLFRTKHGDEALAALRETHARDAASANAEAVAALAAKDAELAALGDARAGELARTHGRIQRNLGVILDSQGFVPEAAKAYALAIDAFQARGDAKLEARTRNNRAFCVERRSAAEAKDEVLARRLLDEALAENRKAFELDADNFEAKEDVRILEAMVRRRDRLAAAKKRKEEEKACKAEGKPYIAPLDPTEAEAQQAARDDKALDARAPASENKRPGWRPRVLLGLRSLALRDVGRLWGPKSPALIEVGRAQPSADFFGGTEFARADRSRARRRADEPGRRRRPHPTSTQVGARNARAAQARSADVRRAAEAGGQAAAAAAARARARPGPGQHAGALAARRRGSGRQTKKGATNTDRDDATAAVGLARTKKAVESRVENTSKHANDFSPLRRRRPLPRLRHPPAAGLCARAGEGHPEPRAALARHDQAPERPRGARPRRRPGRRAPARESTGRSFDASVLSAPQKWRSACAAVDRSFV